MEHTLTNMKQSYIEYALFHYHFKSRISVWLLNYLKASPKSLQNIHFVNRKIADHATLEIGLKDANASAIKLTKNNRILINTNEIFTYITNQAISFDILIHFDDAHYPDAKFNDLIIQQLIHSTHYSSYLENIHNLILDTYKENSLLEQLQVNIDLSLQMNDREQFYQLTQILNNLKARHHYLSSKD